MTCDELRPMIESYLADELPVDRSHEVIAHLESCPACAAEVEARKALRARLRQAIATGPALAPSEAFVAATRQALERQAAIGRRRRSLATWPAWLGLAASLILVAGAVAWWRSGPLVPEALQALVAYAVGDHRNCALHFALDEKPIPLTEAAALYDPMYGGLREAVATGAEGGEPLEILDAHACVYHGRRFGHVVLRDHGHVVSVLVTAESLRGLRTASGIEPCQGDGDLSVACFGTPRYAAFVVSDLSSADTVAVARRIQPALARHLLGA